jgi:hypothetical protein
MEKNKKYYLNRTLLGSHTVRTGFAFTVKNKDLQTLWCVVSLRTGIVLYLGIVKNQTTDKSIYHSFPNRFILTILKI